MTTRSTDFERLGVELMRRNGMPLTKPAKPGRGGPKVYYMADGQTVRMRTSAKRALITTSATTEPGAPLDIEGAGFLLIVMPAGKRSGVVEAFLVPMAEAVEAVHAAHASWLAVRPQRTAGQNRTPVLRFDEELTTRWAHYRLRDEPDPLAAGLLEEAIAAARRHIAALANVPHDAVRITIQAQP